MPQRRLLRALLHLRKVHRARRFEMAKSQVGYETGGRHSVQRLHSIGSPVSACRTVDATLTFQHHRARCGFEHRDRAEGLHRTEPVK